MQPITLPFTFYFNIRGRSSAGSEKHSETHPTKNLINKLLSMPFYGGVAQLGERLNGIQEVKSSILSVSTMKKSLLSTDKGDFFQWYPFLGTNGWYIFDMISHFVRWYMPSAYEGTDIISCLRSKYIIRHCRISYRVSDISFEIVKRQVIVKMLS